MDKNYIIETKNLTKQYGSQKSVADLNIHVQKGRIYGLLGRNGAGKTTTMKMLLGLTKPTSGEVKIWGKSLQGNEKKLLPRIGSLIESPGFYPNLTATENLQIFATLRGIPNRHSIKNTLDLVGLVINIIVGFPGVHFGNLLNMFIRVTGANIGIYISVLPIILIFCCSANNFLGGVALAFVYGYFGTFEGTLLNYYPIKASMILVDPTCGAEYGYTYHIFPAFITIVLTFLISMIILANKKKKPGTLTVGKKKKAVRKKGW